MRQWLCTIVALLVTLRFNQPISARIRTSSDTAAAAAAADARVDSRRISTATAKASSHGMSSEYICKDLPETPTNTWIIAENAMNGISNQLFGVYSFIPMAMIWNVSLIVSGIYTRRSFETKPQKYVGWDLQPFGEYFDWEHFKRHWYEHAGIVAVPLADHEGCLTGGHWMRQGRLREVERFPVFYAQKQELLMKMLTRSNISYPVPPNTILQMDRTHSKLTAMFNYWRGGLATKMLLLEVHRSLKPAPFIRKRIDEMLRRSNLVHSLSEQGITGKGRTYIAVHIRLEGESDFSDLLCLMAAVVEACQIYSSICAIIHNGSSR